MRSIRGSRRVMVLCTLSLVIGCHREDRTAGQRALAAIVDGDLDGLKRAISENAQVVNEDLGHGYTLLHYALVEGAEREVVGILLAAGADPNARAYRRETPLHCAYMYGRGKEVIDELIAAGANPHARDDKGRMPSETAGTLFGVRGER